MRSVVQVLRRVDNEKKHYMSYIYEVVDNSKETIVKYFNNNEYKYIYIFFLSLIKDGNANFIIHCIHMAITLIPNSSMVMQVLTRINKLVTDSLHVIIS